MRKDLLTWVIIINVILLSAYFLIRIANQSQMTYIFPIDAYANDYSAHIADVYFLDVYGYHKVVPNWYNGNYILFEHYPPLWPFFTLPIYKLTENVLSATFISLILMYIIGFLLIYAFSKINKISDLKATLFYLFFFANPIAIGVFLRLGKLPEMFGWLFFISLAILFFYYKDKKLDFKFLVLFILILSLSMYAHTLVFVIDSILAASFFFSRTALRQKVSILLGGVVSAALTFPVWYPVLKIAPKVSSTSPSFVPLTWIISNAPGAITDKITAFIVPTVFWIIFYFYYTSNSKSKEILKFFWFILLISVLYFTRILSYIPYFNRATPDMYNMLLIFFGSYMFFKINLNNLSKLKRNAMVGVLIALPILAIAISSTYTPWFAPHTQQVKDTFSLFNNIDKNFFILNPPQQVSARGAYTYAAIYYNASTAGGWSPLNLKPEDRQALAMPETCLKNLDCTCLDNALAKLKVKQVISYSSDCQIVQACKLKEVNKIGETCLYEY